MISRRPVDQDLRRLPGAELEYLFVEVTAWRCAGSQARQSSPRTSPLPSRSRTNFISPEVPPPGMTRQRGSRLLNPAAPAKAVGTSTASVPIMWSAPALPGSSPPACPGAATSF